MRVIRRPSLLLTLAFLICSFAFATNAASAAAGPLTPVITEGPTEGQILNTGIFKLSWTIGTPAGWMWTVTLDGAYVANSSGLTIPATDGAHTLTVMGYDIMGLGPSDVTTVHFTVDTIAPALAFASGPLNGATVKGGDVAFAFSGESGLPITCVVDDRAAVDCTGGLSLPGLAPGLHSVSAWSTDLAGNTTSLSRLFLVTMPDGTNKKKVRFCYRTKLTKHGKVLRNAKGKVKTRRICKTVSITY